MSEEKENNEEQADKIKKLDSIVSEYDSFMIQILMELTIIRQNIFNNQVFPASSNLQKLSDQMKTKMEKIKNDRKKS